MSVRIVPEDELAYAREVVVKWCSKPFPHMTLGQVQHIALLIAMERQKAVDELGPLPRKRRICNPLGLPITLPADNDEDETTEPKGNKP